jgi:hypothetical protein
MCPTDARFIYIMLEHFLSLCFHGIHFFLKFKCTFLFTSWSL